jgi:hypothetical protein
VRQRPTIPLARRALIWIARGATIWSRFAEAWSEPHQSMVLTRFSATAISLVNSSMSWRESFYIVG